MRALALFLWYSEIARSQSPHHFLRSFPLITKVSEKRGRFQVFKITVVFKANDLVKDRAIRNLCEYFRRMELD